MVGRHPVERALHPAAVRCVAASGGRVIGASQSGDAARPGVFFNTRAGDEVGAPQTHLTAWGQTEELGRRAFPEVVPLDVDGAREGDLPRPHGGVVRMEGDLEDLGGSFGVVLDDDLQRFEDGHDPGRALVQVLADAELQQGHVDRAVLLGHADAVAESADGLGCVSPAAQPCYGGHARVVPARDDAELHELEEAALAHHRVAHIEPGELDLLGAVHVELLQEPVVQRAVVLELQGADGVGDLFKRVGDGVGVVIHGVDAPVVTGAVVGGAQDAVDDRVAHVQVRRSHVDFGPQGPGAVWELAGPHATEQVEILLDVAVAVRALSAWLGQCAPVLPDLVGAQIAHVGQALADEHLGELEGLLEVVGGIVEAVFPVEAKPPHILHDGIDVLLVLLGWVGVVETQVAHALVIGGNAEVQADRLGVPDMQVAVGFRGEAGVHTAFVLPGPHVLVDDGADEVDGFRHFAEAIVGVFRSAGSLLSCHDSSPRGWIYARAL